MSVVLYSIGNEGQMIRVLTPISMHAAEIKVHLKCHAFARCSVLVCCNGSGSLSLSTSASMQTSAVVEICNEGECAKDCHGRLLCHQIQASKKSMDPKPECAAYSKAQEH
eukprot:1154567-Pelagomonas_calceolata.AAC.4